MCSRTPAIRHIIHIWKRNCFFPVSAFFFLLGSFNISFSPFLLLPPLKAKAGVSMECQLMWVNGYVQTAGKSPPNLTYIWFFYDSLNSTNHIHSNPYPGHFHMWSFIRCTSDVFQSLVWMIMSNFILIHSFTSLKWDRRYNSASEEAGRSKIKCKQWMKPARQTPLMDLVGGKKVSLLTKPKSS